MDSRCLKILLAIAAVLLGTGCGAASAPPADAAIRVGVVANAQDWDKEQDAVKATGVGWIREQFLWELIEPRDDQWNWERYDRLLTESSKRGLRVLPLLMDVPRWAAPQWNYIPRDPSEYAEYVAKVTARYGPGGHFWDENPGLRELAPRYFELWNEPYYDFFAGNGVNPGRYARLVKAAARKGRRANRSARFLLAADTGFSDSSDRYHDWVDELYDAVPDLNRWYDGVAVHPYSDGLAPQIYTPGGYTRGQVGRLAEIHSSIRKHGARGKRLWITEIGWSTCRSHDWCVTEKQQASYIRKMYELSKTRWRGMVAALFIYHLRDHGDANGGNPENWFGTIRRDGSKKPSYRALQAIARSG
jgi:hypothetical protein